MRGKKGIISAIGLILILLTLCSCGGVKEDTSSVLSVISQIVEPDEPEVSVVENETVYYQNPLTGLLTMESEQKTYNRPFAVMVNNIAVAQSVQCGLNDADIIYETEVEGGITRLMAVYQDIESANQIGSVRSCRYAYIDLALGHNAIYAHCGQDETYAKSHLKDINDIQVGTDGTGKRISNGLNKEHTLYTFGTSLMTYAKKHFKTTQSSNNTWVNFSEDDTNVLKNTAQSVNVPFSNYYNSKFVYSDSTGRYTRYNNGTLRKDYKTGKDVTVKNVFVLLTSITDYPDGYHRKVDLTSGKGYYFTNGTYCEITWSKGNAKNCFIFKNTDGTALTVTPGNSWVCIASKTKSVPTIK